MDSTISDLEAACNQANGTDRCTFVEEWDLGKLLREPVGSVGNTTILTDGRVATRGDQQFVTGVPSYAIALFGGMVVGVMITPSADLERVLNLIRLSTPAVAA